MTDHLTRPVHFKNNLADPKGLGSLTFSSWPAPVSILSSLLAVETNPSAALHLAALLAIRSIAAHISHPSDLLYFILTPLVTNNDANGEL